MDDAAKTELDRVSEELEVLKGTFFEGTFGVRMLPTEQEAKWSALLREAKGLVDDALGPLNDFSNRLSMLAVSTGSLDGGASIANVEEVRELIAAAARRAKQRATGVNHPANWSNAEPYVHLERITDLPSTSGEWDFSRLSVIVEELNAAWSAKSYHAVAMLGRALLDHVPPLFGQANFGGVIANYGEKSFKDAMKHLDGSLRAIADGHLHTHIKAKEALPSANQVDFRSGIDRLLAEIGTSPWIRAKASSFREGVEPKTKPRGATAADLAFIRILLGLWQEKLLKVRSKHGALLALQIAACTDFLADVEALYGIEVRRRTTNRFPSFVDRAFDGAQRDAQMKTAAMQDVARWEQELSVDRLSPDHSDLPTYVQQRVKQLRAEAPNFGLGA